jgi:long-chain acyl-CoA synthetase
VNAAPGRPEGLDAFLTGYPGTPDSVVVHWMTGSLTLKELTTAARTLADVLGAVGRTPVASLVGTGAEAVVAAFATWLAGGVYVPVNARLSDAEVRAQLLATGPAAVIASRAQAGRIPAALTRVVEEQPGVWTRHQGREQAGTLLDARAALIMRTSGITGPATPVVLEHEGVRDGIDAVIARLRKSSKQEPGQSAMPNLIPSSLALWAGLWNALFALRLGAPVVLLDRFDTADYATLVKRFGIRSTILAPAMMTMLTEDPRVVDLSPLRLVRSVTAPLAPGQARRFYDRFGVEVLNSYGQTELGGEVVGWTAADLREFGLAKLGAVGRPHPGVSVRILDDARQDVPDEESGEIWVRSPFAPVGTPVAGDRVMEGFLRTGDLGRVDADGFVWIEGRVSDMINRGGLKIVPQEVEEVLRLHPHVADACVAGVPDERLGEVPVAWVRAAAGARPDPDALRGFARDRLAGYKVPVAVRFVDDFPRTEIGKVLRRELVAAYAAHCTDGSDGTDGTDGS